MRFRPDAQVVYRRSRVLLGWAVGCWLGVAIQELLWQWANALAVGRDLNLLLLRPDGSTALPLSLIGTSAAGALAGALASTAMAGRRLAGYLTGATLTTATGLLLWTAWPGAPGAWCLATASWLGATVGVGLASRLIIEVDD